MTLLDTDIVSLHLAGHPRVTARLNATVDASNITVVTWIEILSGRMDAVLKAANGEQLMRAQHWLTRTREQLTGFAVFEIKPAAAAEFDRLRQNKKLKKIGRADLLIAAIALANRATLVSRNLRHFRLVPGLLVENWADEGT
jgi:tRNA(fMet)-specific endonuclease VapC